MTREYSTSILNRHDTHEKMITSWFGSIVALIMGAYNPRKDGCMAHFLYYKNGVYTPTVGSRFDFSTDAYIRLLEWNHNQGVPILACSVILPLYTELESKKEVAVLVTRETPVISKRQVWVEVINPHTDKPNLILDEYLSKNMTLPPEINRFSRIIQPFDVFN